MGLGRCIATALATGLLALTGACATAPQVRVLEHPAGPAASPPAYASGQVVVSRSGGALSVFFSLFPEHYHPYIHTGVIAVEDGVPHVYHTMGVIRPSFRRPPTAVTRGRVRRTPLDDYVRAQRYVEVYDPPAFVDRERVVTFARDHFRKGTPFDPYFNTRDRTRLYCTEFVALALEAGGGGPYPITPNRDRPSLAVVTRWLGIDAAGSIQGDTLVHGHRHVATLSSRDTLAQARLRSAAYGEIHRRFTPDQRLGHVFSWNGAGLSFRPGIAAFLDQAVHLADGAPVAPTPSQARDAVSTLARELLGPTPTPPATTHAAAPFPPGQ